MVGIYPYAGFSCIVGPFLLLVQRATPTATPTPSITTTSTAATAMPAMAPVEREGASRGASTAEIERERHCS